MERVERVEGVSMIYEDSNATIGGRRDSSLEVRDVETCAHIRT